MRRLLGVCFGVWMAWLASCSSSDSTGGSGSTGGSAGTGGSTQESCTNTECFAPFKCVHECGGTVINKGCCGCGPDLIDVNQCARDANTTDGQGGASEDSGGGRTDARACEQAECFRANECVSMCGGEVLYAGCCACDAPLFDRIQCDGGK